MKINEVLEKLSEVQLNCCKKLSRQITQGTKDDINYFIIGQYMGQLRGFLDCLKISGVLTFSETEFLYHWFRIKDRSVEEKLLSLEEVKSIAESGSKWIAVGDDGKEYESVYEVLSESGLSDQEVMLFAIPSNVTILGYKAIEG